MSITSVLQTIILISASLTILLVLFQQRGASLGAGMGGSGELFTTRRGLDKSLFNATIVVATVFVLSIIALVLIPS